MKTYSYLFSSFSAWCRENNHEFLPADPLTVALFLISKHRNSSSSQTITSYFAAIKWAHNLANQTDPTNNFLVKEILEACKRLPKKNNAKIRQPLPFSILLRVCKKADGGSLA